MISCPKCVCSFTPDNVAEAAGVCTDTTCPLKGAYATEEATAPNSCKVHAWEGEGDCPACMTGIEPEEPKPIDPDAPVISRIEPFDIVLPNWTMTKLAVYVGEIDTILSARKVEKIQIAGWILTRAP